jgi:hypothetical protein
VDHYRFTHEHDEEREGGWSTPEEERTFLRVRDLLMEMHGRGSGIYIMPVQQGMQAAGGGSGETNGVDGRAVGVVTAGGGQDPAIGPWLDEVVEAARDAAR